MCERSGSLTLKIPSGVTLAGEEKGTVLFLSPTLGVREAL